MHEKFIWAGHNLEITHESDISYAALPVVFSHAIAFCGLTKELKDDLMRRQYLFYSQQQSMRLDTAA